MLTWYQRNPDKAKAKQATYRREHPERVRATLQRCVDKTSLEVFLWRGARKRAAERGLEFSIQPSDIHVPGTCPILGIALRRNKGKGWCDSSPTLDRVIGSLGYTPENIRVISWRANRLKSDGTLLDFERIVSYLKGLV